MMGWRLCTDPLGSALRIWTHGPGTAPPFSRTLTTTITPIPPPAHGEPSKQRPATRSAENHGAHGAPYPRPCVNGCLYVGCAVRTTCEELLRGDGVAVVHRPLGWRVPAMRSHGPGAGGVTKFVTGATLMVHGGVLLVHRTAINGKSLREKDSPGGRRRPGIPDRGPAGKTNDPASRLLLATPGCRVGANGLAARTHDHNGCGTRETVAPQTARSRRQGKPCRNPSCGRYRCQAGCGKGGLDERWWSGRWEEAKPARPRAGSNRIYRRQSGRSK